jgi:hypothetical protein
MRGEEERVRREWEERGREESRKRRNNPGMRYSNMEIVLNKFAVILILQK